jgi:hypothetical protein
LVYDRAPRTRGRSKFNFWGLLSLAADGILHHSVIPLRLAMATGLVATLLAFLGATYFIVAKLFFRSDWPIGLASINVLILLSIGMNAMLIGILGEYIGRIYKNVKSGPLTIIEAIVDRWESTTPAARPGAHSGLGEFREGQRVDQNDTAAAPMERK